MVREAQRFPARRSAGAGSGTGRDGARALAAALEALDLARWDDLPDATLPWDRVSELAEKQGIGEADVVWDLTAGMPPAPPMRRGVRKTALVKRAKPPA